MILPADQAKGVARGRITVVHLPMTPARTVRRPGPRGTARAGASATYQTTPWAPRPGAHEPVQSRAGTTVVTHGFVLVAYAEVTTLRPLLDLTASALATRKAAGYRTGTGIAELAAAWMRNHDVDWPPQEYEECAQCAGTGVVRYPYTGYPGQPDEPCAACRSLGYLYQEVAQTDDQILERFDNRHADTPVYAILVGVDRTLAPRFLSWTGRPRGDERGYTDNPASTITEAGEAVPVDYQERLSRDARKAEADDRRAAATGRDLRARRRQQDRYKRP